MMSIMMSISCGKIIASIACRILLRLSKLCPTWRLAVRSQQPSLRRPAGQGALTVAQSAKRVVSSYEGP